MKITDLLSRETLIMELEGSTKAGVIDELAEKLDKAGCLEDKKTFKEAIWARESQGSTGIGDGIAIPHAKTGAVKKPAICFGRSTSGIEYDSLDGKPARLFFMIAAPDEADEAHLETLSRLSVLLMNEDFRKRLLQAASEEEILKTVRNQEVTENQGTGPKEASQSETLLLAVTACPTGIAHTYMAADALKAKAEELGVSIKVETNGSTGIKNRLTAEEIGRATAIIVAADKQVEMDRFHGKRVIQASVADGIHKAEALITKALKQDAPVYQSGRKTPETAGTHQRSSFGIYKHLMNGVSNMLPFVVGGGIFIALAFAFGGIEAKGPIAELFMKIGGSEGAFHFLVPILAGFIASSIADRPGFAPGVVGGFLSANAGAGFLGGLIAGFLAGYMVILLKKVFSTLPDSLEGIKPVLLYPVFGILITGVLMVTVINTPVVALNEWLTQWLNGMTGANAVILGLILGGMMAVDMGGPINKAAFTFGIAAIETGNLAPHAAVMAGGMVPPLSIALATTFFKSRFTDAERKSGLTNYVMGASFITEGAIPFAAADPLRVLTSCIIGSAVAGAVTMMFGITLPAPHGGVFVIPLVNRPIMYILAILTGSVISAVCLGLWKKKVNKS
ncbi:PTS fructose transporter subunit IIABC [Thermoactinomyces mirandus]|uniref:PTS sugar transporter subunit IIA n=1 Tax=Thermoactinomyces mirandus TaxID=2756294 RepID=A0A7W2ARA9_9BACL|nr:fructose-specific PTS transporter subunit EIIC [Thermoactinomyces mirandus]MBA4602152.1 PTS sugar transporter subunit IIA [Thermoactinomyces mirandus]